MLRAETPPPRRQQPAANADDAWTSSPLPRPMKIPEESCFSSPRPFASPTPAALCHAGKENVRPLQPPLVLQTPVKTPGRLPTVQEQEGQMPSLAEADNLPVYVASTPTPMKEALDFSDLDGGELWLPKVKHTFYNFDTPLRMVDHVRSPPKSAPPGCAPPGLDHPDGLFGGPLPAAPPMPSAGDAASWPLPGLLELPSLIGKAPAPPAPQGDVRRLDLALYLDAPSAPPASAPAPLPAAPVADATRSQGQWMDWHCMQGAMVMSQHLEMPMQSDFSIESQCWVASPTAPATMQDGGMSMVQGGMVMDSMQLQQHLAMDPLQAQAQAQMQAQLQMQQQHQQQQQQQQQSMQQLQALMHFWQMPYQSAAPQAMQVPAPPAAAPEMPPQLQLQLPLPLQPPVAPQMQPATCPSASEQLMALPQILAEPPSMPAAFATTDVREGQCLFTSVVCGAVEPLPFATPCADRPAFPAPEAPPPAVSLAQTPQPPRVSICAGHFPPPSTPQFTPEPHAATPPPPQQPPQQPPSARDAEEAGARSSEAAKDDAKTPPSAKAATPSSSKSSRRRRGAR